MGSGGAKERGVEECGGSMVSDSKYGTKDYCAVCGKTGMVVGVGV